MSQETKHIDEKIKLRSLKQTELSDLGEEITASSSPTTVAFVDLADSTTMKENRQPEDWLGSIYEFLKKCTFLVEAAGGTVVKRIGDEIMATFNTVNSAQSFVESAVSDGTLQNYNYKIALDFGDAYHFKFIDGGEADPYGTVVDRCARIAKLAKAGFVLCSDSYVNELGHDAGYTSLGTFPLKGILEHPTIYFRSLSGINSDSYTRPLIASVNSSASRLDGFKVLGRRLQSSDLRVSPNGTVRPFLAQELLNIPKARIHSEPFALSTPKQMAAKKRKILLPRSSAI